MRISDSRYDRDRFRIEVACRMIRNEARTCTIRQGTGLSDDRIRKLYRSYFAAEPGPRVRRRRGKSPRQMSFFTRTAEHEVEAATLAALLRLCGLLGERASGRSERLEDTARFCSAYETFRSLCPAANVSFEHAWFLRQALLRHEDYSATRCPRCGGLRIRDRLALQVELCAACRPPAPAARREAGPRRGVARIRHPLPPVPACEPRTYLPVPTSSEPHTCAATQAS